MAVLLVSSLLLIACGADENESVATDDGDNANQEETNREEGSAKIPDEVIKDADADPIELEHQMGLAIGETGYTVPSFFNGEHPLAITLNGVEQAQDIGQSKVGDDDFFLVADFTLENLGEDNIKVEKPHAAKGSDESAIQNEEMTNMGELIGIGERYLDENGKIDLDDNPTNSLNVAPGEKVEQKIAIGMRDSTDEYMIVFGFFDGNNQHYMNKVSWTFKAEEVK